MIEGQTLLPELVCVILSGNCEVGATTGAPTHHQAILKPNRWKYLCSQDALVVQLFVEHLVLPIPLTIPIGKYHHRHPILYRSAFATDQPVGI